jgi:flagellar protein FliO/FliZ
MFVLLCIVALAWLAKRVNRLQSSSDGSLQVLGGLSMGARERVVLVQVGSTQLLLGVAPGRINMLHQLEQPLGKNDSADHGNAALSLTDSFSEKLHSALSGKRS